MVRNCQSAGLAGYTSRSFLARLFEPMEIGMRTRPVDSVQSPLNLILPIKSWLQFKESSAAIHFREEQIIASREAVGNMHFARYVELGDHNHLGYFAVFDGEFRSYFSEFINYVGPVFDVLFQHVVDGPPLPCARNREPFIDWIVAHKLESIAFYTAYPTLNVKEIKARIDTRGGGADAWEQSHLTLLLPVKSPNHFVALRQLLTQFLPQLHAALDTIGTVHFFRFVPFGTHAVALVAEHDDSQEKLAQDFSTHLGSVFNEIFENVMDGPPTPVQENMRAFTHWIVSHNLEGWTLYSAYPTLDVKKIRSSVAG